MSANLLRYPKILWGVSEPQYEQDCACSVDSGRILTSVSLDIVYSDCACSSESNHTLIDEFVNINSQTLWQMPSGLYKQTITPSNDIVFNSQESGGPVILNRAAQDILYSFIHPVSLENGLTKIANPPTEKIIAAARNMVMLGLLVSPDCNKLLIQNNTTLTAWLHLTDRCNLRCSYCYLPHVREDMPLETGRAAVDATYNSAMVNSLKKVKLKYAGGEPLLQYPLILELHSYARQLADKYGLTLEEVVLSNGTLLTDAIAKILKSLSIQLMISMDGLGHYHDSQRPYAGGHGSFRDVLDAVDIALSNGLVPNVSVTVSGRTVGGLPDIVGWILEHELPFSLNFYRENELSSSHKDMQLDEQKIISGMMAAFKVIEGNLPKKSFLGGIIDRANLSTPHTHTCGAGQNYLVFDQNGQIAKCQMHIRKPVTDIHAQDPLAIIRADQIGIQNMSVEEKEGCKTCEWKYWCTGGCPLETHRATGRYDVKSPNCNIYKALYPEALRLEGLRLLKYASDPEVVMQ